MIEYRKENIFDSACAALVNPVNCEGTAEGLSLAFKKNFPENFRFYEGKCCWNETKIGMLMIHWEKEKMIVNFPVKTAACTPPALSFIEKGLAALAKTIPTLGIHSIAIPALGCENGALKWEDVKALIEKYLSTADCRIVVIPPKEA